MRALRFVAPASLLAASACLFDATGSVDGGGGAGAAAPGGASADGGAPLGGGVQGGEPSQGGFGASGAGGNGGASNAVCGDDFVEVNEEDCEDDNENETDGCVGCAFIHECENGTLEPTEECEVDDPNCEQCVLTSDSGCFDAPQLEAHADASFNALSSTELFLDSGFLDCGVGQDSEIVPFRFDVGPYPRGLDIRMGEENGNQMDPFVFATYGCGHELLDCVSDNESARLVTHLLDPGLVLFGAIGDKRPGDGQAHRAQVRFHRFHETFTMDPGWNLESGWGWNGDFLFIDANKREEMDVRALSPEIFVGGLTSVDVAIGFELTSDDACTATLIAAVDGSQMDLATLTGSDQFAQVIGELDLNGATHIKIGAVFHAPPESGPNCGMSIREMAVYEPLTPPQR